MILKNTEKYNVAVSHTRTFILLSSFHHNVSIQFLQLSMQAVQPAV